jgi:ABC-2 type transport system permease protein
MFGKGPGDLWPDLWLLLIGAASIPLGLAIFLHAERFAQRTGRLKRSG